MSGSGHVISKLWAVLTVVLAAVLLTGVDGDDGDAAVMVIGLLWADQQCNGFPLWHARKGSHGSSSLRFEIFDLFQSWRGEL